MVVKIMIGYLEELIYLIKRYLFYMIKYDYKNAQLTNNLYEIRLKEYIEKLKNLEKIGEHNG